MNSFPETLKNNAYINLIDKQYNKLDLIIKIPLYATIVITTVYSWNLQIVKTYHTIYGLRSVYRINRINQYLLNKFPTRNIIVLPFYREIFFQVNLNSKYFQIYDINKFIFEEDLSDKELINKIISVLTSYRISKFNQKQCKLYLQNFLNIVDSKILLLKLVV